MKKTLIVAAAMLLMSGAASAQNYWPMAEAYTIGSSAEASYNPGTGTPTYTWERIQCTNANDCSNVTPSATWETVAGTGATLTIPANTVTVANQRWQYRRCANNANCSDASLNKACTAAVDIIFW